ncbi:efflux transporter outer membrane subunit [Novosphingobium aerophilum]|uniref:efflux transporter outer membrane subunit n=1 Tax=Novosphingobium aerophilum TaxID=2839843 RepID=UPI0012CD4969|nr:TolC family protein [Novosphingobium sp.]
MGLRFVGIGAFVTAGAVLSACAPSVQLQRPDLAVPAAFAGGATAAASLQEFPLDRWWSAFADPQLNDLVETALARSTTARLAASRLAEARATRSVTRAGTLPSGNLAATATETGTRRLWGHGVNAGGADTLQATFYPSWEVDLFGRLAATREQADVEYASSSLDFHAARLALAADVASSLFDARSAAIDLATARERLEIAERLAQSARIGLGRGLTSGQDADRLESDLASARAEVPRLEAELQAAKRSLLILTGTPDAATDSLTIEASLAAPPVLPATTPGILLARRPDVLAAGLAVQSAALGVRIDRLALFPRFTIDPGIGLTAATGGAGGGTGLWSLAAGLAVPLLDRTRLMAQLRVTEARGNSAVVSYEQTVQNAFGETENALVRLAANRQRMGDLETAERRSRSAYDSAARGYRNGLTDLTTLLQSEQTWLAARAARDAGRLALLTGTVAAVRAMGGGWEPVADMPAEARKIEAQGAQ